MTSIVIFRKKLILSNHFRMKQNSLTKWIYSTQYFIPRYIKKIMISIQIIYLQFQSDWEKRGLNLIVLWSMKRNFIRALNHYFIFTFDNSFSLNFWMHKHRYFKCFSLTDADWKLNYFFRKQFLKMISEVKYILYCSIMKKICKNV